MHLIYSTISLFKMLLEIFAVLFHITTALSKSGTVEINNHDNNNPFPGDNDSHFIRFEKHQQVVTTVSDKFLSFSIDMALLRSNTIHIPISNGTFINLAQHLKPAYVRIGGTAADFLHFDGEVTKVNSNVNANSNYDFLINGSDEPINNFTFTGTNFLSLFEFSQITGNRLLFDLSVLLRNADGSWDSDNPEKLVLFAKAHKMELDWQLGNEPNSFPFNFNITITAEQLSQDYCKLRNILKLRYGKSILVGPEVNHIDDGNPRGVEYAEHFLRNVNNCIDYITCHQYYLHGQIAKIEDFVNPAVFNRLHTGIKNMQEMLKSSGKNISMWISETSSASGGGAPELSDRYVAGFLWLDKLGVSAKAGVKVVVRQTLLGGNYAMVSHDFEPNPDWWVSVLFKKFVSGKVLNLITPDDNLGRVRLYAHCSVPKSWLSSQIVIYGMNLNSKVIEIRFGGPLPKKRTKVSAFYLTSDSLQSRNILLNGKVLKLESNGNLPHLRPKAVNISQPVELPAFSMVFLLLNDVESSPC